MKKFTNFVICTLFILISIIIWPNIGSATETDIDKLLQPYQKVIDRLNIEYGSSIQIPSDKKEEVYNNIKSTSLDVFERNLRRDYEEVKDLPNHIIIDTRDLVNTGIKEPNEENVQPPVRVSVRKSIPAVEKKIDIENDVEPYSIREDIIQEAPLDYGKVYLEAEIFSGTGERGTFKYTKIYDYGHYVYNDRIHFRADTAFHNLQNSNKECKVVYEGSLYTADGTILTVYKKYTITYLAG